ncbi:hypothetical protein DXA13_12050 [Clostridium sp. AM58-1XD]|nr:hypothetical protein DXA13_12050 [Clostridium sp. AM58-1XD]
MLSVFLTKFIIKMTKESRTAKGGAVRIRLTFIHTHDIMSVKRHSICAVAIPAHEWFLRWLQKAVRQS